MNSYLQYKNISHIFFLKFFFTDIILIVTRSTTVNKFSKLLTSTHSFLKNISKRSSFTDCFSIKIVFYIINMI